MRKIISEADYIAVEQSRKKALSQLITRSGLSYSSIADATGVERRAVKRAADGEGIRFDTAVRLEFFLRKFLNDNETKTMVRP